MRPKISLVLILGFLIASIACAKQPPAPTRTPEQLIGQNLLIIQFAACVHATTAQRQYLGGLSTYRAQRYLLALATSDAEAECDMQAIKSCESVTPGACIAPRDEAQ